MVDPVVECCAAAAKFEHLKKHAEATDIPELAAGLVHIAAAIRAIADPGGVKLSMDWPWSISDNVEKPAP